jgi:hypothetical protein
VYKNTLLLLQEYKASIELRAFPII